MVHERLPFGGTPLTHHAPEASDAIHREWYQQGAQYGHIEHGGWYGDAVHEPGSAYYNQDPLSGGAAGAYNTGAYAADTYSAGPYGMDQYPGGSYHTGQHSFGEYYSGVAPTYDVDSPYQTAHDAGVDYPSAVWGATGHGFAPGTSVWNDPSVVTPPYTGDQGDGFEWADPNEPWFADSYVPEADQQVQTQMWGASSDTDAGLLLNSPASPDFSDSLAVGPRSDGNYSPAPEPELAPSEHSPLDSESFSGVRHAASPAPRRAGNRNRRASARRSALLTVAAPSVAFMGIAAIAASSTLSNQNEPPAQAAPDVAPAAGESPANGKLDSQLAGVTADADDFADRASRTQERIDLRQRQLEEEKRRRAREARREALRPKFRLPVTKRGLGERFGASGPMWSQRHSGLDFVAPMNTPVMAVTDGTVETKWDPFLGNMVIITAPDGTETWYCHLASAKIRSGHVKAGDVIAYAGSTGNSSGSHLHLEVHPGGGGAVDPLPWLRSHGLAPE